MVVEVKHKTAKIFICVLLAALFGLISVAYDYSEYAIFFDIVAWALVLGVVFYLWAKKVFTKKGNLAFRVGALFTIGISVSIIVWAPWSLDFLWDNRGNATPSGIFFLSGVCTFGMFFFSTLGLMFPLVWSGLVSFHKKGSRLSLMLLLLIVATFVSALINRGVIGVLGIQGDVITLTVWLTETVVYLSLFLVWYFVFSRKWFDVDYAPNRSFMPSDSKKPLSAIVLLFFPLVYSAILLFASYADDVFFEGSMYHSLFALLVAIGPWIIAFYIFFRLEKESFSKSKGSIFVASLIISLVAWSRGGVGFIWGFPVQLSMWVDPLSSLYFLLSSLSDFLALLVCSFCMLFVACWLKSFNWRQFLSRKAGSLCALSLLLTVFLKTADTIVVKLPIENYFLSMQLFVLPSIVAICFVLFHVYFRTLGSETEKLKN